MGVAAAALIVSTAGVTYMLTVRTFRPAGSGTVAQIALPNNRSRSNVGPDSGASPVSTEASSGHNSGTSTTPDAGGVRIPARLVNQTAAASRQQSDLIYGREIDMLQKIVSQRETQLDSSTVAIIRKNLLIIDTAIEQSRAALARDPASRMLDQQLTHALDKKVELLRTAAMLRAST
jgi:hypothetical protein